MPLLLFNEIVGVVLVVILPGFKPLLLHLLAAGPRVNSLTSLCLGFLMCTMGIIRRLKDGLP